MANPIRPSSPPALLPLSEPPRERRARLRTTRLLMAVALGAALTAVSEDGRADEVEITPEARSHFEVGVNLLEDPDGARYEEAYRSFKAAYAASPSYKILGNLGLCAMKLERDSEAIAAYEEYLAKAMDLEESERAQIERDLNTLKTTVVKLKLEVTPAGANVIDTRTPVKGAPITNRYGPLEGPLEIGIRAGQHQLLVQADGYADAVVDFDASAGTSLERSVVLEVPSQATPAGPGPMGATPGTPPPAGGGPDQVDRPIPAGVWVGLAATGVFAVAAGVTGVLALSKKSEFDDANNGGDPAAADDLKSSGQTMNILTDVFIGGAVVAAVVTTVLFVTRPEAESASTGGAPFASIGIAPSFGARGGGANVVGTF